MQPEQSTTAVLVEYAAHPSARIHVATGEETLVSADLPGNGASSGAGIGLTPVGSAERPVTLRFIDKATRQPVAVRLHLHGEAGEYLPPRGHHRKVNPGWFEDNYGEFVNDHNQYAYISGECIVDLPLGARLRRDHAAATRLLPSAPRST